MSLETKNVLYRLRLLFDENGKVSLAETVHKETVFKDGQPLTTASEDVKRVTGAKMQAAAEAALAAFAEALASDEAEIAAKKKADEEAEKKKAEAKAAAAAGGDKPA